MRSNFVNVVTCGHLFLGLGLVNNLNFILKCLDYLDIDCRLRPLHRLRPVDPIDLEGALHWSQIRSDHLRIRQHVEQPLHLRLASGELALERRPSLVECVLRLLLLLPLDHVERRLELLNFIRRFIQNYDVIPRLLRAGILARVLRRLPHIGGFEGISWGRLRRVIRHDHRLGLPSVDLVQIVLLGRFQRICGYVPRPFCPPFLIFSSFIGEFGKFMNDICKSIDVVVKIFFLSLLKELLLGPHNSICRRLLSCQIVCLCYQKVFSLDIPYRHSNELF